MKTKRTLLSLIVFLAVFCLSELFEIQRPLGAAQSNHTSVKETPVSETVSGEIQSLSYESPVSSDTSTTQTKDNTIPNDTSSDSAKSPKESTEEPTDLQQSQLSQSDQTALQQEDTAIQEMPSLYSDFGIAIADDYVNIRKKANTGSDIMGKLYKNAAAKILKVKDDWYYIESGSVKGYVKSEFMATGFSDEELIEKYGKLCITVKVDGLNVREKPDMDADKVTVIYMNETYPVVKEQGDWIKVNIADDNVIGYVKSEFADVTIEFDKAVSKEEELELLRLKEEERLRKETEIKYSNGISYTNNDVKLLACLIHAEAGSQSYEGKLAVANIVLNRVKSSKFPNSIEKVIYAPGQFTVASSGSLGKQLANYDNFSSNSQLLSIKAAKQALEGANNIGNRLYFHSYRAAVRKGYDKKSSSVKIDDQLYW